MVRVSVPTDKNKLKKQISALEWQLTQDKSEKDREIHRQALTELKRELNQ